MTTALRVPSSRENQRLAALSLAALVLAFGQTGCSTAPSPSSVTDAGHATQPADVFATLRVGETAEALRARLGAPLEIKPMPHEAVQSEVWVYRRPLPSTNTQVATGVEMIDAVDPLNGRAFQVPQAKHETVVVHSDEVIRLLLINGQLTAWTTARETKHNY